MKANAKLASNIAAMKATSKQEGGGSPSEESVPDPGTRSYATGMGRILLGGVAATRWRQRLGNYEHQL